MTGPDVPVEDRGAEIFKDIMEGHLPVFEIVTPDGGRVKIFTDGRVEGVEHVAVINFIPVLMQNA